MSMSTIVSSAVETAARINGARLLRLAVEERKIPGPTKLVFLQYEYASFAVL